MESARAANRFGRRMNRRQRGGALGRAVMEAMEPRMLMDGSPISLEIRPTEGRIFGNSLDGTGDVTISAGMTITVDRVREHGLSLGDGSTVQINTTSGNYDPAHVSILNSLSLGNGSLLQLGNNALIINAAAGTEATVVTQLNTAIANGQITGTLNTTCSTQMVAVWNNNGSGGAAISKFCGVSVGNHSILVMRTLPGDATMDGQVTISDTNVMAAHWQQTSGANWVTFDFTGDGAVTIADLNAYAAHWQQSLSFVVGDDPSAPVTASPFKIDDSQAGPDVVDGDNIVVDRLRVPGLQLDAGSTVVVSASARGADDPNKVSILNDISFYGGTLDLKNNALIIRCSNSTLAAYYRDLLNTALADGDLFSSMATSANALGVIINSERAGGALTTFRGQSVGANDVLVMFTKKGDLDFDGQVTITDSNWFYQHWQQSGDWSDGDFTYDGQVTIADLNAWSSNWQATISPVGGADTSAFGGQYVAAFTGFSSTPEGLQAQVNFGDGTDDQDASLIWDANAGVWEVLAAHTYEHAGTYTTTASVYDGDWNFVLSVEGTATVLDAPIHAIGTNVGPDGNNKFGVGNLDGSGSGVAYVPGSGNVSVDRARIGNVTVASGGTLKINSSSAADDVNHVSVVSGLDLSEDGSGVFHGTLDLTNNALVIHATSTTYAAELAYITAALKSGYHSGQWNGAGIISSTAASTSGTSVGLFTNQNASGGAILSNFRGDANVALDAYSIIVMFTRAGDLNMDGMVTISDTNMFFQHWQQAGNWWQGDFNYDGTVNISDMNIMYGQWQQSITLSNATESGTATAPAWLASFTDENPYGSASEFTPTIAWGDNSTSSGGIVSDGGKYYVFGSHAYASTPAYVVNTTVTSNAGSVSSARTTMDDLVSYYRALHPVPDANTDDSGTINSLIAEANLEGIKNIILPAGTFQLKSLVTVNGVGLTFSGQGEGITILDNDHHYDGQGNVSMTLQVGPSNMLWHDSGTPIMVEQAVTGNTIRLYGNVSLSGGQALLLTNGQGSVGNPEDVELAPAEVVHVQSTTVGNNSIGAYTDVTLTANVLGSGEYTNVSSDVTVSDRHKLSIFVLQDEADHVTVQDMSFHFLDMSAEGSINVEYATNTTIQRINTLNFPTGVYSRNDAGIGVVGSQFTTVTDVIIGSGPIALSSSRFTQILNNTVGEVTMEEAVVDTLVSGNTLTAGTGAVALWVNDAACARNEFSDNTFVNASSVTVQAGTNRGANQLTVIDNVWLVSDPIITSPSDVTVYGYYTIDGNHGING